jgi:hypothetical protein
MPPGPEKPRRGYGRPPSDGSPRGRIVGRWRGVNGQSSEQIASVRLADRRVIVIIKGIFVAIKGTFCSD